MASGDRTAHDKALARYVRREVYPYSEFNRTRLIDSGLGPAGVTSRADLRRLPPVTLADLGDGRTAVLRPERDAIVHFGRLGLLARLLWAAGWGRHAAFLRKAVEPRYRPVQWTVADGVPIGSSRRDIERVAQRGAAAFDVIGLRRGDVLVGVGLQAGELATVQLSGAASRAGVAWLPVAESADVDLVALAPTALAGPVPAMLSILERGVPASLRTLLATDGPLTAETRARLSDAAPDASALTAACPPGVRALWFECGPDTGLHAWPGADVLDVDESGEIVWSPLGWAGTVILRLRTGWRGRVVEGPCPNCRRVTSRIHVDEPERQRRRPVRSGARRPRRAAPLTAKTAAAAKRTATNTPVRRRRAGNNDGNA